jgi:hypothetical protein
LREQSDENDLDILGENTRKNGGNFFTEAFTGIAPNFEAAPSKLERRESVDIGYNNPDLYLQQNNINQYESTARNDMINTSLNQNPKE